MSEIPEQRGRCGKWWREFRVIRPDGTVVLTEVVVTFGGYEPFVHWQACSDSRLDVQGYPEPAFIDSPWRVEYRDDADGDEWVIIQSSEHLREKAS